MSIAVSIILLVLVLFAYRGLLHPKGEPGLFVLRLAVLVMFVLMATGQIVSFAWQERPHRVAVLVDRSRSMEAVRADSQALELARQIGSFLPRGLKPQFWSFGDSVYSGIDASRTYEQTRLGRALDLVLKSGPAAVVLLSDGQDNGDMSPVGVVEQAHVPVYTVGFGQYAGYNLRVREPELPGLIYAGDTVQVRVYLSGYGLRENLPVRVAVAGQERIVIAGAGFSEQEIEFPVVFTQPGKKVVSVRVESLPGEITFVDNQAQALAQVQPARVRMVYFTNNPGPNTRFILALLRQNPRVSLEPVISLTGGFNSKKELAGDVYLLDGVSENEPDRVWWQWLESQISGGAGLFFIAGVDNTFGPVLNRLLPLSQWRVLKGSFTPVPTGDAEAAGIFEPGSVDFNLLAPFSSLITGVPKAGAVVWFQAGENGQPIAVAGNAGKGRVVYFGGYPLWRWGFLPEIPLAGESPLAVFLDRMSRYLAEQDTSRFVLETGRLSYLAGEPVRLQLRARRPGGDCWEGLDVRVRVDTGDLWVPMVERGAGVYEATVSGSAPGSHHAVAEVRQEGVVLGNAGIDWVVDEQGVEFVRLGLNRGLLERLAQAGNGWFVPAESLHQELIRGIKTRGYQRRLVLDPRGMPWWFGLMAVLFGVELLLRRRKGLY
ncbi:MAG: VWA domain-containing protein [candidate division WOR-3 bacterium]|uniref:VWA domain-containing protein n=2 Tax=candidate division WOR-3 bacterium TaxID=2052148 RepID=A0A7C1T0B8_UNCW3|nr:VWA domain-containing protein [candidate division WOR-3 bacterium]